MRRMQRPVVLAFVLCEQYIVEEKTRNVTLVNCFSQRFVEQDPPEPLSFVALAQLSAGQGEMPMGLVIERMDTLQRVFERYGRVRFSEQLQESRFSARVVNCVLPILGPYQVLLFAEGELIALRKFHLSQREDEP